MARDGTFVTFQEDVTAKTDYDVIGGTENALRMVPVAGGDPVTIVEAKDLKGLTLRWSDDGRTFAYAKKGEVFVQRIDEKKPRSLTPPPPKKEGEKAEAEPAKDAPADAAEGREAEGRARELLGGPDRPRREAHARHQQEGLVRRRHRERRPRAGCCR